MQTKDKQAFNLELQTVARFLCLKPYSRRAVRLDIPQPVYKIELRENDKPIGFILYQAINKNISELAKIPLSKPNAKIAAKYAAKNSLPWFALLHWQDNHFGLLKGADYFQIDDIESPKNNPQIILTPTENLAFLYSYEGKNTTKII